MNIVGEEKRLNPVEDYKLTLKMEIVKKRRTNLLTRLYCYQYIQNLSFNYVSNHWIVMSDTFSDMVNTNIYLVTTFEELERYRCYLDGIEYILKTSEK